jgi:hypothetical protein
LKDQGTRGALLHAFCLQAREEEKECLNQALMSAAEFTKFVTLAKDLAPFVVILVDPSNRSRRQDRSAQVTRQNLEWVLNGHAVPLFR